MPPRPEPVLTPESFDNFGELLHHLRRQARLTQTELGIAVGYSNGQISRLEQNRRLPDQATLTALFLPALNLTDEPRWASRLLDLAAQTRRGAADEARPPEACPAEADWVPGPVPYEVDRPAERQRLASRLNAERRVVLSALAGMGKTTLAAAVAREFRASRPVFWMTLTAGVNTAVDALVRQLAAFLDAHGQAQVRPLLQAADSAMPFSQQINLLSGALNKLVPPPLLCIDNVHLVRDDTAAMQMLRHLMAASPALFLLTSREDLPLPEVAGAQLGGLAQDEGARLIQQLAEARAAASPLDPILTAHLLDKTGGSPMLLRLALGHLLDGRTDLAGFVTQLEVHPQVAAYLLDTVQRRLSPAAWALLCQLSVFRQAVNLYDAGLVELIQAQADAADIGAAIAELQACQVIDNPAQARLHPLVRDYVYAGLSADPARRRRLHLLAAEWAESQQNDPLRAARHYVEAGAADQAAELLMGNEPALVRQGQALSAVAVLDGALEQARRARPQTLETLRKLLAVRAQLLMGSPRQTEAEADYSEALTLSEAPQVRAELAYRLGLLLSVRARYSEALAVVKAAEAALPPADVLLRAQLYSAEGQALYRLAQYDAALETTDRALALGGQLVPLAVPAAHEALARAYYVQGDLARVRGDYATAEDRWQRSVQSARLAGLPRQENAALVCLGGVRYDLGDLAGSWELRSQALALARQIGHSYLEAYALLHLADIHHDRCEFEAELVKLDEARERLLQLGDRVGAANASNQRAEALLAQGRLVEARDVIAGLLAHPPEEGMVPRLQAQYMHTAARLEALAGRTDEAAATLAAARALPDVAEMPVVRDWLALDMTVVQLAGGKLEAARETAATIPAQHVNLWMDLQSELTGAALALTGGRAEDARARADQVLARAGAAGHELLRREAARLSAAASQPPEPAGLPRLLWVAEPNRPA